MMVIEFLMVFLAFVITFIGFLYLLWKSRESPIVEMRLISLGIFYYSLGFLLILPTTILNSIGQEPSNIAITFYRLGFVCEMIGILHVYLSLFLPNFKLTYLKVMNLVISSSVLGASAIVNFYTLTHQMVNNRIFIRYTPLGILLLLAALTIYFYNIGRRITDIISVLKKHTRTFEFSLTFPMTISIILMILIFLSLLFVNVMPSVPIPSFSWTVIVSILILFLIYQFLINEAFFFLTPARLEAIIIANPKTGLTYYSRIFRKFPSEEYLGSIFVGLALSLEHLSGSRKRLEKVYYADKLILIGIGKYVSSFLVVSEKNFITLEITRYSVQMFEKKFFKELKEIQDQIVINKAIFSSYDETVDKICQYIPL